MTAEIAVLNKTAVALAADSAMTISAGQKQEKIFDTADKLFELSLNDPIGVMIYNGLSFMGIPLPVVVKEFRAQCPSYDLVTEAGNAFLNFLQEIGQKSPPSMHLASMHEVVRPIIEKVTEDIQKKLFQILFEPKDTPPDPEKDPNVEQVAEAILADYLDRMERWLAKLPPGSFIGGKKPSFSKSVMEQLQKVVSEMCEPFSDAARRRLVKILRGVLQSGFLSSSRTGLVFAGFGKNEKFPTLISFEIDGMVGGKLKYRQRHYHDIDRDGDRAVVLPFAQKEMVDRFLYGLDDDIQSNIVKFCSETVGTISKSIIDSLNFGNDEDKKKVLDGARVAEKAFVTGLKTKGFKTIVAASKSEIEEMVEFMPKPELAKMAEALIDLTSIKRRVSKGMETVGGPVDVAVISKSEGFVWVKRKHYFPPELNARYFSRIHPAAGGKS